MIIRKVPLTEGTCFALLPKPVPEGWVWFEYVKWRYNEAANCGLGGNEYRRIVPRLYSPGLRAQFARENTTTFDADGSV